MLQRTRRVLGAPELRTVLGVQHLAADTVACVGGEWRREGTRWRFWRETEAREGREARPAPASRQWWMDN